MLDFVASKGFPTGEHKVLSSWPRRDVSLTDRNKRIFYIKNLNLIWESTKIFNSFFQLTTVDASKTLEELKLFPQETLTLEEK